MLLKRFAAGFFLTTFSLFPLNVKATDSLDNDLCILLYLDAIYPHHIYLKSEICYYLEANREQILTIKTSPNAVSIYADHMDDAQGITVINRSEQCEED